MKNKLLLPVILSALALASCSKSESGDSPETAKASGGDDVLGALAARVGDHWTLVDADGSQCDGVSSPVAPGPAVDGEYTMASSSDRDAVYTLGGDSPEPIPGLNDLVETGFLSSGLIPVVHPRSRIEYFHADGTPAFALEPVNGQEIVRVSSMFHCGRAVIMAADATAGVIDTKRNVIVAPGKYIRITDYAEDLALAYYYDENGTPDDTSDDVLVFTVLDTEGNEVLRMDKGEFALTSHFVDGVLPVCDGRYSYIYTREGRHQSGFTTEGRIIQANSRHMVIVNDGRAGLWTLSGTQVVAPDYESMVMLPDDRLLVSAIDGSELHYGIIDLEGNEIHQFPDYCYVSDIPFVLSSQSGLYGLATDFKLVGESEDGVRLYDYSGNQMTEVVFSDLNYTSISSEVASDYFDPADAGRALASRIVSDAIGGVSLHMPVSEFNTPESGFVYGGLDSNVIMLPNAVSNALYFISDSFLLDHSDDDSEVDPKVKMSWSMVSLREPGYYANAKHAAVKTLRDKGYELLANNEAYSVLGLGYTRLVLIPYDDENGSDKIKKLAVFVMTDDQWEDYREVIAPSAVLRYESVAAEQISPPKVQVVEEQVADPKTEPDPLSF